MPTQGLQDVFFLLIFVFFFKKPFFKYQSRQCKNDSFVYIFTGWGTLCDK